MLDTYREVVTPEGVGLHLPAAGPVPRALAWGIDLAIRHAINDTERMGYRAMKAERDLRWREAIGIYRAFLAERPGDIKHSMASSDKLQQAGWRPRHSVAEGLAATVAYFKSLKA